MTTSHHTPPIRLTLPQWFGAAHFIEGEGEGLRDHRAFTDLAACIWEAIPRIRARLEDRDNDIDLDVNVDEVRIALPFKPDMLAGVRHAVETWTRAAAGSNAIDNLAGEELGKPQARKA